MKKYLIVSLILVFGLSSCVQKTHKKIVELTLDVSKIKNIKTVGVRGAENPLSWDTDYAMKEIVKDSLYRMIINFETGRLCSEIKFSVNGNLELEGKENRKIYFETENDTTFVNCIFDTIKKVN
ncbi:hypothetical protein [Flavobacterium sp.]|uniref:hypothetical protein n=1 Tax=Flavobacterium sp. TaxID=239 RepID=UPI00286E78E3|nr:hypothetical protein [Flavobacterium sp.]